MARHLECYRYRFRGFAVQGSTLEDAFRASVRIPKSAPRRRADFVKAQFWRYVSGFRVSAASAALPITRPFVYAIVDNATGLPVFMGAVVDLG